MRCAVNLSLVLIKGVDHIQPAKLIGAVIVTSQRVQCCVSFAFVITLLTSLRCRCQTGVTRCFTPAVLYIDVDGQ